MRGEVRRMGEYGYAHPIMSTEQYEKTRDARLKRLDTLTAVERDTVLWWLAGYCPEGVDRALALVETQRVRRVEEKRA